MPGKRVGNSRVYGVTRGGKRAPFKLSVAVTPDIQRIAQQVPRQFRFVVAKSTGMAINRTMTKIRGFTQTRLAKEMGVKRKDLNGVVKITRRAYAQNMSSKMSIRQGPLKVSTDRFGATYGKGAHGVSHRAWGRRQVTPGSFLLPGLKTAFLNVKGQRTSTGKQKLKLVYGPWAARKFWDEGQLNRDAGPPLTVAQRAERCAQRELPYQLVQAIDVQIGRATGRIKPMKRGMPRVSTQRRKPRKPARKC